MNLLVGVCDAVILPSPFHIVISWSGSIDCMLSLLFPLKLSRVLLRVTHRALFALFAPFTSRSTLLLPLISISVCCLYSVCTSYIFICHTLWIELFLSHFFGFLRSSIFFLSLVVVYLCSRRFEFYIKQKLDLIFILLLV